MAHCAYEITALVIGKTTIRGRRIGYARTVTGDTRRCSANFARRLCVCTSEKGRAQPFFVTTLSQAIGTQKPWRCGMPSIGGTGARRTDRSTPGEQNRQMCRGMLSPAYTTRWEGSVTVMPRHSLRQNSGSVTNYPAVGTQKRGRVTPFFCLLHIYRIVIVSSGRRSGSLRQVVVS